MKRSEPLLNFRVSDDTKRALDEVLLLDGRERSRSEFIREAVEAAIRAELAALTTQRRKLGFMLYPSQCVHPPQALKQMPFFRVCSLCGEEIRKLS